MCGKNGYVHLNVAMQMLERVGQSDRAPMVCVIGRWVTSIFSMPSYTHHRCMSIYIVQREHICFCG